MTLARTRGGTPRTTVRVPLTWDDAAAVGQRDGDEVAAGAGRAAPGHHEGAVAALRAQAADRPGLSADGAA